MIDLKGTIHSKVKILSSFLAFVLFQTCNDYMHLSSVWFIEFAGLLFYPSALLEILAKSGQLILDKARSSHAV